MKTVIITGCSGGVGTALNSAFKKAGYYVVGTDRVQTHAICDAFVELDLLALCSDPEGYHRAVETIAASLPDGELSVLVNNAAVQRLASTRELTHDDWNQSLSVNLSAPFFLTKALLPHLERARGTVINIGSVHASATKPRFVAYAATKAGLVGLTRALAVDLAPRVRVLAVNPAAVDTVMLREGFGLRTNALDELAGVHPLGRIASPDEISRVVVFLASDGASFMTGAAVDIDGGVLSRLHDPE